MNFIDAMKNELYSALTENGDKAYTTSGSYCLDFFALSGGLRHNYTDLMRLYLKAFYEDKILAIKILFYLRDIRGGLGERNSFRFILNTLSHLHPEIASQIIEYIPKYGRFDDLLVCLDTPVEKDVISLIKKQLDSDIENYANNKEISLLSKWLPSVNTSSSETRRQAKRIARLLGYNEQEYRKTLAKLRKGRVLEVYLSSKDYSFEYEKLPSQALFKHIKAFLRNDEERYSNFIENNSDKIKTSTLFPYQITSKIRYGNIADEKEKEILNKTWDNIDRTNINSKTIVVLDGSGSMYTYTDLAPIDIASSLAILFSEQLTGPYKNTFITFSENPKLIQLKSNTIFDKVHETLAYYEVANTNITKVYELILNTAIHNKLTQEDLPDRVVIISDMEFDYCAKGVSTFENAKARFIDAGYKLPELVFWNVEARSVHLPVQQNEANIKLVSGASKNIIELIIENKSLNPYDFMISVLNKYQEFENIKI